MAWGDCVFCGYAGRGRVGGEEERGLVEVGVYGGEVYHGFWGRWCAGWCWERGFGVEVGWAKLSGLSDSRDGRSFFNEGGSARGEGESDQEKGRE